MSRMRRRSLILLALATAGLLLAAPALARPLIPGLDLHPGRLLKPATSIAGVAENHSTKLPVAAPTAAKEMPAKETRPDIRITSDEELDRDHGIRSGRGTMRSPFVISGWHVGNIVISDTSRALIIRDNVVDGVLVLDWNGSHVHVHHNQVGDLRVNRNVPRLGFATSGSIAHNAFGVVGQLRHWDGVFEHNTVGVPAGGMFGRYTSEAVNFDGFNGARFRLNTIYGFVNVKLHGHHHGSGYGMPSHEHTMEQQSANYGEMHGMIDHTQRYHEVWVSANTIYSDAEYALRYDDAGHAGNDRTNDSEAEPALNLPHVHHTRIHMIGNHLIGSGLQVLIFNADDDHHIRTARGIVEIRGNKIDLADDPNNLSAGREGIVVRAVKDGDVRIVGNVIRVPAARDLSPTGLATRLTQAVGIHVGGVDLSRVWILNNVVEDREIGVLAQGFTETVHWWVRGLKTTRVETPVSYDGSVANPPYRS